MQNCEPSFTLHASFNPPKDQLPSFPICEKGSSLKPTGQSGGCIYQNSDNTWSRRDATDVLVRQENLKEYPPLANELKRLGVRSVIDAGANDGFSTFLFASGLPEARVIGLEPSLSNYFMLRKNTHSFHSRVTPLRSALWGSSLSLSMNTGDGDPSAAQSVGVGNNKGGDADKLPGVSVPRLLDGFCLASPIFLKMDIEGAEVSVMASGSESWLQRIKYLYMEAHPHTRDPVSGKSAVAVSVQRLLSANMTVVTNPTLTMNTWTPWSPRANKREYVFLACNREVKASDCMALCHAWRAGTGLECKQVRGWHASRRL